MRPGLTVREEHELRYSVWPPLPQSGQLGFQCVSISLNFSCGYSQLLMLRYDGQVIGVGHQVSLWVGEKWDVVLDESE